MAWKQALAKLKQELKEEATPPPAAKQKIVPKPPEASPRAIEEEDAMFLMAMGGKPKAPKPASSPMPPAPTPQAPLIREEPVPEPSFGDAMAELKGMKPIRREVLPAPTPQAAPPPAEAPQPALPAPAAPLPLPLPAALPEELHAPLPSHPRLIHLAAGMAIDVDGSLDLRSHSIADARERLRERIQDGRFLGWRTLHVALGPDPALAEMLLSCIQGAEATHVMQYAQAPIPMGGNQAWILYFPSSHS